MDPVPSRVRGTVIETAKVLVVDPIDDTAVHRLRRVADVLVRPQPSVAELLDLVADADVVILRSGVRLTASILGRAAKLKVVVRAGTGVDNIDLETAWRAGVRVFTVPGASANAVAELAIGLTLAVSRRIAFADRQVRAGEWRKAELAGLELSGKDFGLVGFGEIGARVARMLAGFSPRLRTTVRLPTRSRRAAIARQGVEVVDLPTLLRESDVVCLAVPLTDLTRRLIGADELRAMRRHACLINVSRGGVVDEDALAAALREGTIAGAGLDVHESEGGNSPFAGMDNVVLTPHIGAMSVDAQRRIGNVVVDTVIGALGGATTIPPEAREQRPAR
ncbi:hydroxyacid dehydrogenase [Actinosynnema sp. NPDC004786]